MKGRSRLIFSVNADNAVNQADITSRNTASGAANTSGTAQPNRLLTIALAGILLAFVSFSLIGCSPAQNSSGESQKSTDTAQNSITDAYGRTVELPEKVESAATVGSAARFVVYAGAQDKLVAVTEMEKEASLARPYTKAHEELFSKLPATSNGNHLMETNVNSEQLLEINPDVIISSRSAAECDDLQNAIQIPVVGISYQDQIFSDDVYRSIEVVGEALDTSEHANNVIASMKIWAAELNDRTANIPDEKKPTCYVGAVNYKGAKSFEGSYANYAPLQAVNAINVTDELGQEGSVIVDLEQLGAWNPDFMFLNAGNMDLMKADYTKNKAFFDSLKAFQNDNLFSQPSFNFNGTNVEMGICNAYFIGATIYPDAFEEMNMTTHYDEIFETMLGIKYYETMKAAGMNFTRLSF